MPKLTVEGLGTFEVPTGKRLVLALEDDAKVISFTPAAAMPAAPPAASSLWPESRSR